MATASTAKRVLKVLMPGENAGSGDRFRRLGLWSQAQRPLAIPSASHLATMRAMTRTIFRPVGRAELALIEASGWREFPPRLPIQPIFYPVLTQSYAEKIARDSNTNYEASGFAGFVLEFDVDAVFLERYPVQVVGDQTCQELWVPAEELDEFNRHIVGQIRLVASY